MSYQINISAQDKWERVNSPTTQFLRSVHFVDSLYGWAAGDSGVIIHSSDCGNNWIVQDSKTVNNIYDIFFLNRDLGWAVSWDVWNFPAGTELLKTTDGGINWIRPPSIQEDMFTLCVLFQDSLNGWMGGKPHPIIRTTDGGFSWTEAEIDSSDFSDLPVYDIEFHNSELGYACGGMIDCCGIIWWTTDGGNYWSVIDTQFIAPEPIYKLYTRDSLNVLGVGGDYESTGFGVGMIRSSNGGLNWDFNYIGMSGVAWDIDYRTSYEAWAPLGGEQKLIFSLDTGSTWIPIPSPDSTQIFKVVFSDSLHGIGVGMDGAIIKYKPDISNVQNEEEFIPEGIVLYQNYPNPFNPSTKLSFVIGHLSFVTLKVYDILGDEITTLLDGEKPAGRYEVEFNGTGLPSGIYFYKLHAGNFIETRKMVLIR